MVTVATRDLADTRDRLQRWLVDRFPPGSAPVVSDLDAPAANGMSSETLLFDVTWSNEGEVQSTSLVARVAPDPANVPVFPVYDMEAQFRVLQIVHEVATVPVPKVQWCEPDPEPLGTPFFVMDRVEGIVPPDVMPYNMGSWVTEASLEERRRMQDASVDVVARIHAIDRPTERFDFLGGGSLRQLLDDQRAYYRWVAGGLRSPLIERAFAWLEDHWPADEGPTVLCWGDSRIGNIMYRDFEPVAVFDWEMATLGPPEVDLAWFVFLHEFFEDIAQRYGVGGLPDFLQTADVVARYETVSGCTPRDVDWYRTYAALRHAIIMSQTARRSIHFGEAEQPDDIDDLIHHRALLERMITG
jgi:aminoglycoside phosphotransferase (APT) family kinase protein